MISGGAELSNCRSSFLKFHHLLLILSQSNGL